MAVIETEKPSLIGHDNISAHVKTSEKNATAIHVEGDATLHGMRYLHIDEELQKRVVRKLDWNIMPIVLALCML